jgi:hypothetical protein
LPQQLQEAVLVVSHWDLSITPRYNKRRRVAPRLIEELACHLDNERTLSTVKFDSDPVKNVGNEAKHGLSLSSSTAIHPSR